MALSVAEGTPIKPSSFSLPETRSVINLSSDTFTGSRLIKGTREPRFHLNHKILLQSPFALGPYKVPLLALQGNKSGRRWSNHLSVGLFNASLLPACDIICLTKVVTLRAWMSSALPGRKTFFFSSMTQWRVGYVAAFSLSQVHSSNWLLIHTRITMMKELGLKSCLARFSSAVYPSSF